MTSRTLGGAAERIFHAVRRNIVIDPHANAHGVDLSRVMEIDDGGANDLVVRNIEINVVVRAQAGGSPVDLHHFGESISHLQPVAPFVRPVNLDRHAGNDSAEEILPGKTANDRGNAGAGEHAFQLAFGVIAEAQNKEERDQEKDERDHFAQKMGNSDLPALFKIQIKQIAIDQGEDES